MKLQNSNQNKWLQEFNYKWKVEAEQVYRKCRCMQKKFVVYSKESVAYLNSNTFHGKVGGEGTLSPADLRSQ